jgi:hypothetical protein
VSRKDYEALASAINTAGLLHTSTKARMALREVMQGVAGWCQHDNKAFNAKRFMAASTEDWG